MIKAVPKATAVVVNPTHYAVALQYEMNSRPFRPLSPKERTISPRLFDSVRP